jgi:hypothetical protein
LLTGFTETAVGIMAAQGSTLIGPASPTIDGQDRMGPRDQEGAAAALSMGKMSSVRVFEPGKEVAPSGPTPSIDYVRLGLMLVNPAQGNKAAKNYSDPNCRSDTRAIPQARGYNSLFGRARRQPS